MNETYTPAPKDDNFETNYDRILTAIHEHRFHPADNNLVAQIDIQQQHGSIILPDSAQVELNTAKIICLADNLDAGLYKPGLHVIPVQHAGRELCSKGNHRLVIYDVTTDLHAIVTEA